MRKVIDTYNNLVKEENFEYDLLITVMLEEEKGIWIVLNEMISGVSVCFPPIIDADSNECQQAFNKGGVVGAANYIIDNLGESLERYNELWDKDYVMKIINHIKESEAFELVKKYM